MDLTTIDNLSSEDLEKNIGEQNEVVEKEINPDSNAEPVKENDTWTPPKEEPVILEFEYKDGKKEGEAPAQTPDPIDPKLETYNKLVQEFPSLAKFDNLDEIVKFTENPTQAPQVPKPEEKPDVSKIQLNDRDNGIILDYTIKNAIANEGIQKVISKAQARANEMIEDGDLKVKPITKFPTTEDEWDNLERVSPALYNRAVNMVNDISREVTNEYKEVKFTAEQKPIEDEKAVTGFVGRVEKFVKQLYPGIQAKDSDVVKKQLNDFIDKNLKNDDYSTLKNGVKILDENKLYANWHTENIETINRLHALGQKAKGTGTLQKIQNASKQVSQKTLANMGKNDNNTRRVNVANDNEVQGMDYREVEAALSHLDRENN